MYKELLQRLVDDLEVEGDGCYSEDADDRKVRVADDYLEVRVTFEPHDDRGASVRNSVEFTVEDGELVCDNGDACPLAAPDGEGWAALQEFVNEQCSYHCP